MAGNQLRLSFSALAYSLVEALRRLGLRGTDWAQAQVDILRLQLLKIGTLVRVRVRRVFLSLSSAILSWEEPLDPRLPSAALLRIWQNPSSVPSARAYDRAEPLLHNGLFPLCSLRIQANRRRILLNPASREALRAAKTARKRLDQHPSHAKARTGGIWRLAFRPGMVPAILKGGHAFLLPGPRRCRRSPKELLARHGLRA